MPGIYRLHEIPERLSWWELKVVIRKAGKDSALVRQIDAANNALLEAELERIESERETRRIAALPEDERPIGDNPVSIEEMDALLLKWSQPEEVTCQLEPN